MLKSKLILLFTMIFFAFVAQSEVLAGTQKLATITNDEDREKINLEVVTDASHDITHLKLIFINDKNVVYDSDLYLAQKAAAGIVLYKVDNRDVVKLSSRNFSEYQGGEVQLDFLYNGITGSRAIKKLDISRDGDSWKLFDQNKHVKKLHFVSNKKALVGTIGIKAIVTN